MLTERWTSMSGLSTSQTATTAAVQVVVSNYLKGKQSSSLSLL